MIQAENLSDEYATGRLALNRRQPFRATWRVCRYSGCQWQREIHDDAYHLRNGQAHEGKVRIAGQDITTLHGRQLANARMGLGMVFQHAHLVKRRSVLSNVVCGVLGRHRNLLTAFGVLPASNSGLAWNAWSRLA